MIIAVNSQAIGRKKPEKYQGFNGVFFRRLPSNCLNWKFTAMITLHFQLVLYMEIELGKKKIVIVVFFKITCPRNSLKNEFPNICTFCFRSLMRSCHLGILCKSSAGHSLPTRLSPCLHNLPFQLQCCQAA